MIIEPTNEERAKLEAIAQDIAARVRTLGAEAIIGGSFAKDTWLSGTRDIDIFARFDVASEAELEEKIPLLFDAFPHAEEVRGSRRYLRMDEHDVTIEVIPIRPLSATANSMDHSPDHITYVREHLEKPVDVRLLKAILKAQRAYGAESHVRGFSGYVCELLIIAFGDLASLARAASGWSPGARVRFHDDAPNFTEPLIVEDPTDIERNAAAAVSEEQLDRFVAIMMRIDTGEPIENLFEHEAIEPPYARVRMRSNHEKHDIAAAQLRKIHDRLERELEPFGVSASDWHWDEQTWTSTFKLERYEREAHELRIGPPTSMSEAVDAFRQEHPDAYEDHGRIVTHIERQEKRWEDVASRVCDAAEVASFDTEEVR